MKSEQLRWEEMSATEQAVAELAHGMMERRGMGMAETVEELGRAGVAVEFEELSRWLGALGRMMTNERVEAKHTMTLDDDGAGGPERGGEAALDALALRGEGDVEFLPALRGFLDGLAVAEGRAVEMLSEERRMALAGRLLRGEGISVEEGEALGRHLEAQLWADPREVLRALLRFLMVREKGVRVVLRERWLTLEEGERVEALPLALVGFRRRIMRSVVVVWTADGRLREVVPHARIARSPWVCRRQRKRVVRLMVAKAEEMANPDAVVGRVMACNMIVEGHVLGERTQAGAAKAMGYSKQRFGYHENRVVREVEEATGARAAVIAGRKVEDDPRKGRKRGSE